MNRIRSKWTKRDRNGTKEPKWTEIDLIDHSGPNGPM